MKKTIVTKQGVSRVDMTPAEIAEQQADAEKSRINDLKHERDRLELDTARGFLWLVKKLLANGTLQMADIPAKLIDYKNRIEEIETELGQ